MGLVKMGENLRKCKVSAGSVCEMTKDSVIFQPILWTHVSFGHSSEASTTLFKLLEQQQLVNLEEQ